jgi:hypothetical protein
MSGRTFVSAFALSMVFSPVAALAGAASSQSQRSVVTDGPVELSTNLDKNAARVAEPIQFVVEVAAPSGTRVELPIPSGQLGDFEIRKRELTKDIPSADGDGKRRWVLHLILETVKTGELTIPSLDVHYATDANSTTFQMLHTKPVPVHITSVLENRADPTKFRDIKDTVDVPAPEPPSRKWIAWTTAGAGVAIAVALLAIVVAKRRPRGPSPAEWALASIEDLEGLPIADAAQSETVFNEVVDIVREFFELQFNVPTMSRTTREFLAEAANISGLNSTGRDRLRWLASLADQVKFARLGIGEQQVRDAFAQAKALVAECELHHQANAKGAA